MSPQQVQQAVQQMGETYKGNSYHLLQRNCNHFSNDLCVKLTGQAAPLWVSQQCKQDVWHQIVVLTRYICSAGNAGAVLQCWALRSQSSQRTKCPSACCLLFSGHTTALPFQTTWLNAAQAAQIIFAVYCWSMVWSSQPKQVRASRHCHGNCYKS